MRVNYNPKGPQWEATFGDKTAGLLDICHSLAKDAVLAAPFSIIRGESNTKLVRELLGKEDGLVVDCSKSAKRFSVCFVCVQRR